MSTTGSLRNELKSTTKSLHKWLESADNLQFLQDHQILKNDYHQLIKSLLTFFQALEPLIDQYKQDFINNGLLDIEQRLQRTLWLTEDLTHGECPIPTDTRLKFKTIDSFSAAAGALYVCEGSTMGGMIIKPQLKKHLGEHLPYRFYSAYGDNTMPLWHDFTHWLDHTEIDHEQALLAASEVFIKLRGCLDD